MYICLERARSAATPSGVCSDIGHFSVRARRIAALMGKGWPCSSVSPAKLSERLSGSRSAIEAEAPGRVDDLRPCGGWDAWADTSSVARQPGSTYEARL